MDAVSQLWTTEYGKLLLAKSALLIVLIGLGYRNRQMLSDFTRLRRSVGLPERDGVLVRGVEDGSPAAAAGIESGDLPTSPFDPTRTFWPVQPARHPPPGTRRPERLRGTFCTHGC